MDVEALEKVSQALTGTKTLLQVAVAIAPRPVEEFVYSKALAKELGLDAPAVARDLRKLVTAGWMVEHERAIGNERIYFERRPCAFWEFATNLSRELGSIDRA